MLLPTQQHENAASDNVQPCSLLLERSFGCLNFDLPLLLLLCGGGRDLHENTFWVCFAWLGLACSQPGSWISAFKCGLLLLWSNIRTSRLVVF
ncbi:hypothetical protein TIFTF001_003251 [Ficus carica]|uniref:Uncharacterized protein n=1 Tax=Ficus carica TaxID=3494 RepID=A0AA87Z764_FICCA|nr:hypothetical protein TIFTF001_003251 [Ficus carica]